MLDHVSAALGNTSGFLQPYLTELGKIDRKQLSRDNQVDYQLLERSLKGDLWSLDSLQDWAWNPIFYTQLTGGAIYGLMAREFAPMEQRLASVTARLEQYPQTVCSDSRNPRSLPSPPIHAETAIKQNRGVLSIIDNMVRPQLEKLPDTDRERLLKAHRVDHRRSRQNIRKWLEMECCPESSR